MLSYRDVDGSTVTTPIYAGSQRDVELAQQCVHEWQTREGSETRTPADDGTMTLEACRKCVAVRARTRFDRNSHEGA